MRSELGRYMFFCDVEGAAGDPVVAEAIEGLRSKAESVRLLGSYPGPLGGESLARGVATASLPLSNPAGRAGTMFRIRPRCRQ